MDIVIPTIRDLKFLEDWREYIQEHHLIIVQDGDPSRDIRVPNGFSFDLYNWNDIEEDLGEDRWIISKRDSACRCYGFLKANSEYVYTIDDDCFPAEDPDGNKINAVAEHKSNLEDPSHPHFFNTLYDQEFVRGYPFSRREGVPTAISHGLWLNVPDFDAPTQMVKPNHKNNHYVNICQTIPEGTLFPMCGMNLGFNRELIGPAMYFGLMGDGYPWGRYDDMWAGWCAKAIIDHLGYGVKSGTPYIRHDKASHWKSNFQKEKKGIIWQEEIIPFFENINFSEDTDTTIACYRELAEQVRIELTSISEYFGKLADAMEIWIRVWEEENE